ncbi:MAG: hypothetical protein IPJ49_02405 [Candidatus Obscuribacter sp.]|nr:hypothetical protein [Candidatus Obscuribacter sp.]
MQDKTKVVRVVISVIVIGILAYGAYVCDNMTPSIKSVNAENDKMLANLEAAKKQVRQLDKASAEQSKQQKTIAFNPTLEKREGVVGITVNCYNGNLTPIIDQIAKGSPAEGAGIKAGQYLVKIDDNYCLPMTGAEIAFSLRGTAGSTVKVTVSDTERGSAMPGGKEQSYDLTRLAMHKLKDEHEQNQLMFVKPMLEAEQQMRPKARDGAVEAPFFVVSPRSPKRMILEFIDDKTGPSKKPPAFVSYADGDRYWDAPGAPPTLIKRFNIQEPDYMALASKFGVKTAPAVVFLPDNSAMIDPSQIEYDPIKNNGLRVLIPSQKRAIPGRW